MWNDAGALADFPAPDRLLKAFQGRTFLNLRETADALEMDRKQFRDEVVAGRIKYVLRGGGESRKLRRFLLVDVLDYLRNARRQECPSISGPTPRYTGASSGSKVYDIADLRKKRKNDKQRQQKSV